MQNTDPLSNPGQSLALADLAHPHASADRLIAAGMSAGGAAIKGELFARAAARLHRDGNSSPAHAAFVPGRIELFGKHTDYCGGRSLLCTVDRGFCMIAASQTSAGVTVIDVAQNESIEFDPQADRPTPAGHWSGYAQAVIRRAAKNFPSARLGGVRIAFISDLPPAAGLSSSSALITGLFMLLARACDLPKTTAWQEHFKTTEDLAAYCGCIENGSSFGTLAGDRGVGTFGGSQDHTAILCCKPGCVSRFSFGPVTREADLPFPAGPRLAVLLSGVTAEKTGSAMADYNAVSLRARRLVDVWNLNRGTSIRYLNEVVATPETTEQLINLLSRQPQPDRASLTLRLEQFLAESKQIIPAAAKAFRTGDWPTLGELTEKSHGLAITHLKNQVPATIELQRWAIEHGALAASAFGAGFGGSVWALFAEGTQINLPGGSFFTAPSIPLTML